MSSQKNTSARLVASGASASGNRSSFVGGKTDQQHTAREKLAQLDASRDRIEVWCVLLGLLHRLTKRVDGALADYEQLLEFEQELVEELKAEVKGFTRYAAYRHRRRRS
jgi:hypothetical protein